MNLSRFFKHTLTSAWCVKRRFPPASLAAIKKAIEEAEKRHQGEIRFVIEDALDFTQLMRDVSPHKRALEIFSHYRVWDTEHNNGILIYLLLADRAVEIIADRGIQAKCSTNVWEPIVMRMQKHFMEGQFETGALQGISELADQLVQYFPEDVSLKKQANELPDEALLV